MGGVSKALGLSGEQGAYFGARGIPELERRAGERLDYEAEPTEKGSELQRALARGEQGAGYYASANPMQIRAAAEDPLAGTRMAEQEVLGSQLGGGVYGDKGLQGALAQEYSKYEGAGLTPETQTELDQAKAQIARQYGAEEGGLAQALAGRGLAAAPSGTAAVEYTGLRGNRNEQLAKANLDAAMKKIQMKRELAGQRMQLANQAMGAKGQQFQNQLAGVGSAREAQKSDATAEAQRNQLMLQRERDIASQQQQQVESQHKYEAPTLGQAFGAGIMGAARKLPEQGSQAGIMALSDYRAKTNINYADADIEELLTHITPYIYEYKNPKHGEHRYISPMAQDLEKSKIGRGLVVETPEGKMVDYARMSGVLMATFAYLQKRGVLNA